MRPTRPQVGEGMQPLTTPRGRIDVLHLELAKGAQMRALPGWGGRVGNLLPP